MLDLAPSPDETLQDLLHLADLGGAEDVLELGCALRNLPVGPRITCVPSAIEQLPFDDASFDAVLAHNTIGLSRARGRAFAEAARVLRPGGRIALYDRVVGGAGEYVDTLDRLGLVVTEERRDGYLFGAESVALVAVKP